MLPDALANALRKDDRRAAALTEKIAAVGAARDARGDLPGFVRALFDYALGQLVAEQQCLAAGRGARTAVHRHRRPR
jgi:hypothetical protein